jgi:type IV secretory pathway VirB2 component (pilin)
MSGSHAPRYRPILLSVAAILLAPSLALAQSPWERAASNLALTFTGPLARSLALVSIVIGGLLFMFGEAGAKRQISGIVFGGGLALFAAQFLTWLHRPLTVCGVDRRLFFLALILGAATFNLFYSFLAGLLMFLGLYGFALWATRRDPDMLRILLASSKTRRRYDPGKHQPFDVEVVSC